MNSVIREANLAIQCTAPGGEQGTFLFLPRNQERVLVSPVFPGMPQLVEWCRKHGWKHVHGSHPVGTYQQTL
jgi:hypothetical protein